MILELTPQEAQEKINNQGFFLLDVREKEEFDEFHAENAHLISLGDLEDRYTELDKDKSMIVICRSGIRSMKAIEKLISLGFDELKLYNLEGGSIAWRDQGLPTWKKDDKQNFDINENTDNIKMPTKKEILEALKIVKDPEIPVNVVDLGLVYEVEIFENGVVDLTMTLTSVGCPVQDLIRADAEMAIERLDGVKTVNVEFVWDPPWTKDKMTEDGKRQMRMFGFNI